MKVTRRGLFGILAAAPLAGISAFRALRWKVYPAKAVILNPGWTCRFNPEPERYYYGEGTTKRLLEIANQTSDLNKSFMEPHTVKL